MRAFGIWGKMMMRGGKRHAKYAPIRKHFAASGRAFSDFSPLDTFEHRHIGPNEGEIKEMLGKLGFQSLEELSTSTVPEHIRHSTDLDLKPALSESEATAKLKEMASKNFNMTNLIGMGYYGTHTPPVIRRNLIEDPSWYTSYTPYQPEISQGRLEMLLNYQTMVSDLTGLELSNASLLDEGTSAAEAMQLAYGKHKGKRNKFFVSKDCHPQTIGVMETRANLLGIELIIDDPQLMLEGATDGEEFFGAMVQYPDTYGGIGDWHDWAAALKKQGIVIVAATDLLALTVLKPPGEWGADIAVGSAQRFGVPTFFGGPHAGFFACKDSFKRKMPGRLIGVSIDSRGKPGYRLAMQTREQHIRRDKATSNICTAQALLANTAASYAMYHGPDGLKDIANRIRLLTAALRETIISSVKGCSVGDAKAPFFDTTKMVFDEPIADEVLESAVMRRINLRKVDDHTVCVSFDETSTFENVYDVAQAVNESILMKKGRTRTAVVNGRKEERETGGISLVPVVKDVVTLKEKLDLSAEFARESEYLSHEIFHQHHSESSMMRYLNKLSMRDVSLTTSMIPLGSCTMKLNSALEMEPVSWPEFANMHPFQPSEQVEGYTELITTLNEALCEITRYAAVSTQPNSGAAGEYAGLLAISRYHKANGNDNRNICIIPISAHGTNPASAVMAGMKVVTVKSDDAGNIDMDDLREKVKKHSENLAALMVTYPSTYGVFERGVKDVIDLIHENGGQVYMDGANMNAQVGLCSPGEIGADVCHLNLHKTFCIPHGGGGPGVGSIGVAKHLAPYLPGHKVMPVSGEGENTEVSSEYAVAAAQYGSAGILPITWMYIHMLGPEGLTRATQVAILNANYMAARLENDFQILYRGENGQCAHEFIIDWRDMKAESGITEEDIAKRLADFGFHAPTMSWPVPGTLMVEPTESENKEEMDRFCDAMIKIRQEVQDVLDGKISVEDSPLRHAPHTADVVTADDWDRKYSREIAAYPLPWVRDFKVWPSAARIDNTYGDRNLVCTCPPLEAYEDDEEN